MTTLLMHPLLNHIQAAIDQPGVATASALKDNGWHTPLWFTGSMTEFDDGRVAIQVEASTLEGCDTPVLFLHLDEAQARRQSPDESLIHQPLGVVGLLTQQQVVDLAIVHGSDVVTLTHSQFMALHDTMALLNPASQRSATADAQYIDRISVFMLKAHAHCQQHDDIRTLHLAAVLAGGAPMRCALLLDASNAALHQDQLHALHSQWMTPGDALLLLDPLDLGEGHRPIIDTLKQQAPLYQKAPPAGWWARLKQRWQAPRLVIIDLDLNGTDSTT